MPLSEEIIPQKINSQQEETFLEIEEEVKEVEDVAPENDSQADIVDAIFEKSKNGVKKVINKIKQLRNQRVEKSTSQENLSPSDIGTGESQKLGSLAAFVANDLLIPMISFVVIRSSSNNCTSDSILLVLLLTGIYLISLTQKNWFMKKVIPSGFASFILKTFFLISSCLSGARPLVIVHLALCSTIICGHIFKSLLIEPTFRKLFVAYIMFCFIFFGNISVCYSILNILFLLFFGGVYSVHAIYEIQNWMHDASNNLSELELYCILPNLAIRRSICSVSRMCRSLFNALEKSEAHDSASNL